LVMYLHGIQRERKTLKCPIVRMEGVVPNFYRSDALEVVQAIRTMSDADKRSTTILNEF
jgi:hypothetical protein